MQIEDKIRKLRNVLEGTASLPGDNRFEAALEIWNSRVRSAPAAVAHCQSSEDVARSVRFARENDLPVAVRAGGHHYAGLGLTGRELLLDLSEMKHMAVEAGKHRVIAEPGLTWGEFNARTVPEGLAAVGGTASSVGIAGFTLGGGSGMLTRKHGMAVDNLLSAEVVTAAGEVLKAGGGENKDLFWAIRGGGGNFGIVTKFEYKLHKIPEHVLGGQVIFRLESARQALKVYREVMAEAPLEFTCYPCMLHVPPIESFPKELHGEVVLAFVINHAGDIEEGKRWARPLKAIRDPLVDSVGPMPYLESQQVFDAGVPEGRRWYSRGAYCMELSDGLIDAFVEASRALPGPLSFAYFEPVDGANNAIDPSAAAFPHRDAPFSMHLLAGWFDANEDSQRMEQAKQFHETLKPHLQEAVYVNLLAEDEGARLKAAYGPNFDRLSELKAKWDPDNILGPRFRIPGEEP